MYDEKYSSKGFYPTPKFSLLSALVLVLVSFMIVGGCGGGGSSSDGIEDNNTPKPTTADDTKLEKSPTPAADETNLDDKISDELPPSDPTRSYGTCDERSINLAHLRGKGKGYKPWKCDNSEFLSLRFYDSAEWGERNRTFIALEQDQTKLYGYFTLKNCNLSVDFWDEGVDDWEAEILSLDAQKMVLMYKGTDKIEHCSSGLNDGQ